MTVHTRLKVMAAFVAFVEDDFDSEVFFSGVVDWWIVEDDRPIVNKQVNK